MQQSLHIFNRFTLDEDGGFGVLKVKAQGHRDLVTVVGSLPFVSVGEWLTAQSHRVPVREYGQQCRAEMLTRTPPTSKEGTEKYLGSGMVKGICPVYVKKLVDKFGEGVFDIIEKASARLEDVDSIGPKRRKRVEKRPGTNRRSSGTLCFSSTPMGSAPAGPCVFLRLTAMKPSKGSATTRTDWPRTFTALVSRLPTKLPVR